jgi:aminoglycoside phosphotransferase (APT) family kinase protein
MKMHANEIETNVALVSTLIASQFPQWQNLLVTPFESSGSSNKLYQLGDTMVVRMPRISQAAAHVAKEQHLLPKLAPQLPLTIPTQLARGVPDAVFPWEWSVHRWIEGDNANSTSFADAHGVARDLASFINALHRIDTGGAKNNAYAAGAHNSMRGSPLRQLDDTARSNIAALQHEYSVTALIAEWEFALHTDVWQAAPVWVHGDLLFGNLLFQGGRLAAVIDFGLLGIGDPACDLMPAWCLLDASSRTIFRDVINTDAATWNRGRGWALLFGLMAVPYYANTNPTLAAVGRTAINAVLEENISEHFQR